MSPHDLDVVVMPTSSGISSPTGRQPRSEAWAWRQAACTATITPISSPSTGAAPDIMERTSSPHGHDPVGGVHAGLPGVRERRGPSDRAVEKVYREGNT